MPKTDLTVNLVGQDGNAFLITGKVAKALREGGYYDLANEFTKESMSGDYDHLLRTVMKYVDVE